MAVGELSWMLPLLEVAERELASAARRDSASRHSRVDLRRRAASAARAAWKAAYS